MSSLADSDLLHVWETMRRQTLPRRAAALLAAATPGMTNGRLAGMSLGERERLLLDLHAHSFGTRLSCVADCPQCGETFEFEIDAHTLSSGWPTPAEVVQPPSIETQDMRVDMRLPTVADSIVAGDGSDAAQAYQTLLQRCLVCTMRTGEIIAPETLPPPLLQEAAARMESADPAAELMVSMPCPACDAVLNEPLDLAAFCWAEVEARAPRLLAEVHALASCYGWSEADILAMSRVRRDAYLGMVSP